MKFTETVTQMMPKVLPKRLAKVHEESPKKFWVTKVLRSFGGFLLVVLSLWLKTDQPLYVWLTMFGFGCYTISADWLMSFVDFGVGAFSRVWSLVKPK